jgi:hypothetical protein
VPLAGREGRGIYHPTPRGSLHGIVFKRRHIGLLEYGQKPSWQQYSWRIGAVSCKNAGSTEKEHHPHIVNRYEQVTPDSAIPKQSTPIGLQTHKQPWRGVGGWGSRRDGSYNFVFNPQLHLAEVIAITRWTNAGVRHVLRDLGQAEIGG